MIGAVLPYPLDVERRRGTHAIWGGAFMALVGWAANAAFDMEFDLYFVPIWFIGLAVLGAGLFLRLTDT